MSDQITVQVLKYDGTEYRRWSATLSGREGSLIVLDAEFDDDVEHELLGKINSGTKTIEYYWLDRCYNIFQFQNEKGEPRLFYCNVNLPPTFNERTLSYIDLDIDILVQPDLSYQILDLEEFEVNAERYGYSADVKARAHAAIEELLARISSRQFPFAVSAPV